jgi:FKBP-type peptidyl-prolyl cis-trans isomerase FklB
LLYSKYYLSGNFNLKYLFMKIKVLIVVSVLGALTLVSCSQSAIKNAKMVTKTDSLSYAFGVVNYNALKQDSLELNPTLVAKAMLDGKEGKASMDETIARGFIMAFINEREMVKKQKQDELNKVTYKNLIAQGDSFLQKNKERTGVIVTASGLQYEVVKMGKGPKPAETSTVKVHYTGKFIDGNTFDSSAGKDPAEFQVNGVIKGWTEALQLMPAGSVFKIYIPESLAYGATGAGEVIKPYSTLIFDVELLEIVKQ